jgi:hypothetical protein
MVFGLSDIYTERGLTQRLTMLLIEYVFTHSGPFSADHGFNAYWSNPTQSLVRSNANGWSSDVQLRTGAPSPASPI